ncbi:hypothetical protein Cyan10605_2230 [Cyanobacterium aponinum PCC 10605]|uniref:Uncharacterized protein n=1 Tax=Cyanobacterium aponinum (strain PCC 10605) TaxID=755178 RepID=K9Z559_CYAAP|nr:hypothetical protein Cyan10605_2230 [Cyanobacterium aponinum PCC 10605]
MFIVREKLKVYKLLFNNRLLPIAYCLLPTLINNLHTQSDKAIFFNHIILTTVEKNLFDF